MCKEKRTITICIYCKDPIYEGEGIIYDKDGNPYHYDSAHPLNNCYYPEDEEDE